MRIGFVGIRGVPAKYGGSETAVEQFGTRLVQRGHDVLVFCRRHKSESDDPEYKGLRRVILPSLNTPALDTLSHSALALMTKEARSCDVIHILGMGTALLLPLARLTGAGIVTTVDGFDWRREKWGFVARRALRYGLGIAFRRSDCVLVDARAALSEFEAMFGRPARYAPYGANIEYTPEADRLKQLGIEPGSYFLFVGRMIPDKGVHFLVEAFRRLSTNKRLVIVGGVDHFSEYADRIRAMSEGDHRITILGPQYGDAYRQLCSHSFAYVQPSLVEGTSPQLLSALGFGRPVIASAIPTIVETTANSALLFEPGNIASLEAQMQRLIDDPAIGADLAKRAREHVMTNYSWDAVTDIIEDASIDAASKRNR